MTTQRRVSFYDVTTSCVVISGSDRLIATGSLLSVNPNRIVAKRVVLSGHPFRINKKSATVRYMFFNRGELHERIVNPLSSICTQTHLQWRIFAVF